MRMLVPCRGGWVGGGPSPAGAGWPAVGACSGGTLFCDPWWTACFFWRRLLFSEEQPWAIVELSTAGLGVVPGPGSWVRREPQGRRDGCPLCGALALSVAVEHRGPNAVTQSARLRAAGVSWGWGQVWGFGATLSLGKSLCRPPGQRLPSGPAAQAPSWWRGSRAACLLSHWTHGWCVCSALLPPEIRTLSASLERPSL